MRRWYETRVLPAIIGDSGESMRIGSRALDLLITLMTRASEIVGEDELVAGLGRRPLSSRPICKGPQAFRRTNGS